MADEDLNVLEDKIMELEEKINNLDTNEPDDEATLLELQAKVDELEMEKSQLAFEKEQQEIMSKYNVPPDYKDMLVGGSYEELEAKAQRLSELLSKGGDVKQEEKNPTQNKQESSGNETNQNVQNDWFNVPAFGSATPQGRDLVMEMEKGKNVFDDVLDLTFGE